MCGRYLSPDSAAIERDFSLVHTAWQFPAHFNVAPGQDIAAVRAGPDGPHGQRLRWGLIPAFAHGEAGPYATFNARAETARTAPSFRHAWATGQRCLVPATGFYEWHQLADGKTKQPYLIRVTDQPVFAFAGLWERSQSAAGDAVYSCTLLTIPANELLARIHNSKQRMPVIVPREARAAWLTGSNDAAWALVQPYPSARMTAWAVSRRVNRAGIDDPSLADPVALD